MNARTSLDRTLQANAPGYYDFIRNVGGNGQTDLVSGIDVALNEFNTKGDNDNINNELDVAHKTSYDISYFIAKNIAYKYLCIVCENIICPFNIYGCCDKIKIDNEEQKNNELSTEEILNAHLINNQHQHLILLLKQTRELSIQIDKKNSIIDKLIRTENKMCKEVPYLKKISHISDDNIWILINFGNINIINVFTVNLQNKCRAQIRIYDISRLSNNKSNSTNTDKSNATTDSGGNSVYDPTQSDLWDVGDLDVVHINNKFNIPIWLQKKYPNLDCLNRERTFDKR